MAIGPELSPLLSVKQTIPLVRDGAVRRTRLEQRLESATKLTAVVAPAGWGKTSLLSRWARTAATEAPVAWVSLDESDDEPIRFWSYVLSSLRRSSGQITSAATDALRLSSDGPIYHALPVLLNELAESTTTHVLVLDDFHVIADHEIHESLEFLLAYLPPTLRVMVASRWDPPLPLARMRVRGELTEVRVGDLRFSPQESAALVSSLTVTELDPAVTTELWERTEGWAAGLQLAGLRLRDRSETTSAAQISGDDRHLFDYVTTEVFPALTPAQRRLLEGTAPLELLSGSLCDAALGTDGSAEVLAQLEAADLFVVALDPERRWYRCHRLLREALLRSPHRQNDNAPEDVLRRAAQWFEDHDRIDDAVHHLLDAGDYSAAEALLRSRRTWFLQRGWSATYLLLGERLPERVIDASLAYSMAYVAEISGQRDRGIRWLDLCDRLVDDATVIDNWQSARAAVLVLTAIMAVPVSDPARGIALSEEALALEVAAGGGQHSLAQIALARSYGLDGRLDDAARIMSRFWQQRDSAGWLVGVDSQVASLLGWYLLQLGRVDELDRLLVETRPLVDAAVRERGGLAAPVMMLLSIVEGRRSHQRGDVDQARAQLNQGLSLSGAAARPLFTVTGLTFLADLELATGNRTAAQSALAQAREIVDNEPMPPIVRAALEAAETRIGRAAVGAARGTGALIEPLTDRELSILRMLPGTATQREIGSALYLSINTVKAYNKSLYRKLGVGARHDAVLAARRLGLI